jgi:RNA polymerase-interacting CarD/CdnL/TRCF family regulator
VQNPASPGAARAHPLKIFPVDFAVYPKTLRKHYRDELDTGQIKATAKVAESLFRKATSDGSQSVGDLPEHDFRLP